MGYPCACNVCGKRVSSRGKFRNDCPLRPAGHKNIPTQYEIDYDAKRDWTKILKKKRDLHASAKIQREKVQEAARQAVTFTDDDRFAAFKQALSVYEREVRRVQEANPGSPLLISLCLYGTNKSVSFEAEMVKSSLKGNKKQVLSVVMIEGSGKDKYWRQLTASEMRQLSDIPGVCVYEYSGNDMKKFLPDLAAHVEYSLQHIVAHGVITENDRRITPLQRIPGNGVSRGEAPFKVGCRIIVLNNDGSLKLKGAIFQRQIPYGLPHKDDVVHKKISRRQVSNSLIDLSKLVDTDDDKKISARRVSESPIKHEELVDTDDEDGLKKPVRKFRWLAFGTKM